MDKNPLLFESVRTLFRSVSEHSYKLLAKDITNGSREKRRERSCRKAGVVLATTGKVNPTQEVQRSMLEGILTRGTTTNFAVDGQDFSIDGSTWIIGELKPGTLCSVAINRRGENEIFAVKIVMK